MKRIYLISTLLTAIILSSCSPYSKSDILFEYPEYNALYYTKTELKKYKYSDYIIDDVSNGAYKKYSYENTTIKFKHTTILLFILNIYFYICSFC